MGFFEKIKAGLTKTRDALSDTWSDLFSGDTEIDDDFYDNLEESLILADLGVETATKATDRLRRVIPVQQIDIYMVRLQKCQRTGDVRLDGCRCHTRHRRIRQRMCAFVHQHDLFTIAALLYPVSK